jgi:hypothetical protein
MQGFGVEPRPASSGSTSAERSTPRPTCWPAPDPQKPFATRDLTTLLGAVSPLTGLAITASDVPPAGAGRRRERVPDRRDARDVHDDEGAYLHRVEHRRIAGRPGRLAGSVPLYALYDGTNLPIVHNTGVDFSARRRRPSRQRVLHGPRLSQRQRDRGSVAPGAIRHDVRAVPHQRPRLPQAGLHRPPAPVINLTTLKSDVDAAVSHVRCARPAARWPSTTGRPSTRAIASRSARRRT